MPIHEHPPVPLDAEFRSWLENKKTKLSPSYINNSISDCRRFLAEAGFLPNENSEWDAIRHMVEHHGFPTVYVENSIRNTLRRYVEFLKERKATQKELQVS